jgi:O-antigen/teichoic acid export membrane protein
MRRHFRRLLPDLIIALGLLLLPLVHFAPTVVGSRTLLPADNLLVIEPWASAAGQFGAAQPVVPHNKLLDDLVLENYPWKKFIIESLQAGELPLWNPYQFAGIPFLAAGQHSALYPFSLVFYALPLPRAYGLFTLSQFFLAGLFTYIYLRVLGLRRLGATFGAVVYQMSLFMVVSVVFTMIIASVVWLPLILTAIELTVRQQPALGGRPATVPWMALGAVALGLQVLAGHPEMTYYTLLVAGAYATWRLVGPAGAIQWGRSRIAAVRDLAVGVSMDEANDSPARVAPAAAGGGALSVLRRSIALLAIAALGIALGAIQLIPLYELVRHNFRSGSATFEQIIGWAYPWRHIIHFFVPNFYGNPSHHAYLDLFTWRVAPATVNAVGQPIDTIFWGIKNYVEGGAYLGLLPLLLAGILVLSHLQPILARRARLGHGTDPPTGSGTSAQNRHRTPLAPYPLFFILLAVLSLAFAFGTPLYALVFWLPGIDQLHSPFRWVWPLTLSVAVLAAFGLEAVQVNENGVRPRASRPQTHKVLRAVCLGAHPSVVTVVAGLAVWSGSLLMASLVAARAGYEALGVDRLASHLLHDLALADQVFADDRMFFSYQALWLFTFAALLVASGLVLRLSQSGRWWRGQPVWGYLAIGLICLDLIIAGWGFNPAADARILTYTPPSVEFLRADEELWRYTTFDSANCRAELAQPCKPFNANAGWYFNLHDVRGYDSIFTRQYANYMGLIEPQYELDYNRIAPISDPVALDSPLLDLLNVKYVITQELIDNPKYTLVYDAEVRIYRNETALPRAYTQPIAATTIADDFGRVVQSLDPRQYVIVFGHGRPAPAEPAWPTPVDGIAYSPNEVHVTAIVTEPSWLILADSYFPGWKAYYRESGAGEDAEQPLDIALVNGNFRGVPLPAGAWTVRFKYSPDSVKLGGIVSFIAGVTLIFLLLLYAWRYFYRESAVDSTARRVAKNSLAPMGLNLANRAIDLAFAAFMLRVLGPDDAGNYYFAIVVFGWFEIFTNYGLNTLLTREVSRDRQNANRYLMNTTMLRLLLGLLAVPALAGFLALRQLVPSFVLPFGLGEFHPDRLGTDTLWAITLLVIAQAPATIATGLSALFYAFEKAEYPAAVATMTTIAKVALGTIALVLGFGFVGLAGVSVLVNTLTLGVLGVLAWRLFAVPGRRLELDPALQRHAVRESFPLMLNNLLATLFFKVDVTLLEPIRGAREVGWYSIAYKFVDAYNVIPALFTFALFPVMSRQAREDRPALTRNYGLAVKLLVAVAIPLAAVTAAAAPLMVGLLGGAEFLPYGATALAILVWSIPFGWINSITNYLLIALDQQRALTRAFALALMFNIVTNLMLLPRYGFAAAAATTIASEIFEGLLFFYFLRRSLGPVPIVRWLWRFALAGGAMTAALYGLWSLQPLLAVSLSLALYAAGVWILGAFSPAERDMLASILPARLRAWVPSPVPASSDR